MKEAERRRSATPGQAQKAKGSAHEHMVGNAVVKRRKQPSSTTQASPPASLGSLAERVGYQLRRAHAKSNDLFVELLSGKGLAPGQYGILKIISLNAGRIQKEVAAIAGVDATTLVPIVEHLERSGWITRTRDVDDRRNVILAITGAGTRLLKKVDTLIDAHEQNLTGSLSEEDRRHLLRLLALITGIGGS